MKKCFEMLGNGAEALFFYVLMPLSALANVFNAAYNPTLSDVVRATYLIGAILGGGAYMTMLVVWCVKSWRNNRALERRLNRVCVPAVFVAAASWCVAGVYYFWLGV